MSQPKQREKGELACDPCRQLKVKCRRDPEDDTVCMKCRKHNVNCTWPALRVRTRKPRSKSAAKIQALEDKIDQLLSVVEADGAPTKRTPSSLGTSPKHATKHEPGSILEYLEDELGISESIANGYLDEYRSMTLYFPFVILPSSTSVSTLSYDKPMLYLAILAVSSMRNRELQLNLEQRLRKEFAESMLVRQEKSLDLLAALLVYLGWSQFFHLPKKDSVQQFLFLAVTVCEELGLGLTREEATRRQFHLDTDEHEQHLSAEAKRLYLGTHFLLNDYSWGFGETSKATDWEHIVECADSLAAENAYPSDALVAALAKMQSFAAGYHAIFTSFSIGETIDPLQLSALADEAEERIMQVGWDLPPLLQQSAILEQSRYFFLSYAFEADLVNPVIRKRRPVLPANQFYLTAILSRSMYAMKAFLDTFLTMPSSEYHHFSFHQWTGIDYSLIMLYKLSLGVASVMIWDVDYARSTVPFESYMEQCITMMKLAMPVQGERKDMYGMHEMIWQDTLTAYRKKKNLALADRLASGSMEVHRRAFGVGRKAKTSSTSGSPALEKASPASMDSPTARIAAHPCPAYVYWKQ